MEPQKAPPGTHMGAPRPAQRAPRDHQAPSRAPLEKPLGPPRPPTNPPKTLSSLFKSRHNAKEGAQSLPMQHKRLQSLKVPQKSMKIKRFSYHTWLIHQGFQSPPGAPRARPADT